MSDEVVKSEAATPVETHKPILGFDVDDECDRFEFDNRAPKYGEE